MRRTEAGEGGRGCGEGLRGGVAGRAAGPGEGGGERATGGVRDKQV